MLELLKSLTFACGVMLLFLSSVVFLVDKKVEYSCTKFGENTGAEVYYENLDACYQNIGGELKRTSIVFD